MENENNNLEDFLRGKFSEIENSEEAWAKPSFRVRNDVLDEITKPDQKKRKRAFLLFLFLLGALLISFGLYASNQGKKDIKKAPFYAQEQGVNTKESSKTVENNSNSLTKKIAESNIEIANVVAESSKEELLERNALLKKVIQNQNDIIIELQKERLQTKNNTKEHQFAKETLKNNQSNNELNNLLAANNRLNIEKKKLKFLNENQQKEIEQLDNEKQLLLDRLNTVVYSAKRERDDIETIRDEIAFEEVKPLIANELEEEALVVEPVNISDDFGLDQPKRKVKFEVGYQLGIRGKMTEVIEYVERQGVITNKVKDKFLVSHVHGLNIGISPVKNFWIKTGAHVGNMDLHQKHNAKFIYNSNTPATVNRQAYTNTNEINYLSRLGIYTLEENIALLVDAQGTQNGDQVDLDFQTNLVLTYLQIPLEFNYIHGKKRLQALFQLGGTWNLLNYQYYMHGFETIQSNQSRTYLMDKNSRESKGVSMGYWGLHAGVGLNYNISKHLVLQGLCSYEYYFKESPLKQGLTYSSQFLQPGQTVRNTAGISSNMGFGIKLGLNYRF